MYTLGIDTSNYTTSAAIVDKDENIIYDSRKLLEVKKGERGLRQQEALFQHTKNLPVLLSEVLNEHTRSKIGAVAVSTRPRSVEGSYMPCFLAGRAAAVSISSALGVPCYEFSHQEGHIAAVAPLKINDFLCYHLSGGTSELLEVHIRHEDKPAPGHQDGNMLRIDTSIIGATKDISAGQLLDRIGVEMGYGFPSGPIMDKIAYSSENEPPCDLLTGIRLDGLDFSLSGIENQFLMRLKDNLDNKDMQKRLVGELFKRLSVMLVKLTEKARKQTGVRDVVFTGGVSSSKYLRKYLNKNLKYIYFGDHSSDNAVGTSILGSRNHLIRSEKQRTV